MLARTPKDPYTSRHESLILTARRKNSGQRPMMPTDAAPDISYRYRFAEYEFRGKTGELWRRGQDLHLPDQAGKVLLTLLCASGDVVTREALKEVLWPDKTHGDFEGGLNAAIRKLRQILEDDGAEPRLIGTLPRHGYRLLVPVESALESVHSGKDPETGLGTPLGSQQQSSIPNLESTDVRGRSKPVWSGTRKAWIAAVVLILMTGTLWFLGHGPSRITAGRTPGESMRDELSGIEFVWVPPGTFLMGSPASEKGRGTDELQHQVTISRGFWLGKNETTQGQYEAVMAANPSRFKEAGLQAPVENVNWDDAQAFLQQLNQRSTGRTYRLPTEAEWEYACRAGTTGSTYGSLGAIAWTFYTSGQKTHPVGQKLPNAWGLFDMLGNVNEWCQDCYKDPYDITQDTDPVGSPTNGYHAIRGGSWTSGTTQCRAAYRASEATFEIRYSIAGFRVVCIPGARRP